MGTAWGLAADAVSVLALVVTELVTNAVIHARTPLGRQVGLTLTLRDEAVRVEVRDADPGDLPQWPSTGAPGAEELSEDRRGLLLVESLCQEWGAERQLVGKAVWADVPRVGITC